MSSDDTEIIPGAELIDSLGEFNLFDIRFEGVNYFEFVDHDSETFYRFNSVVFNQGVIYTRATPIDSTVDTDDLVISFTPEMDFTDQEFLAAVIYDPFDLGSFSIQIGEPGVLDAFPLDPNEWIDTDGDGVGDNADVFPANPLESSDSDSDGVGDNADAFDNDPAETTDSDGDGVGDNADAFDNDPSETTDLDGDGVGDNADAFDNDPTQTTDSDGDGVGDNTDLDDDNDGFDDINDVFPFDPLEALDTDGDGIGNSADTDDDGDGVLDGLDTYPLDADNGQQKVFDIDGNGQVDALTDTLLITRFVFGFTGDALTDGALGQGAIRTSSEDIEAYLKSVIPEL